jgi:DNA repair protein RadC
MAQEFMVPLYHLELVRERDIPYTSLVKKDAAIEVFHTMLDSAPVEKLAMIHCNSGLDMIGAEIVAIGSMEQVGTAMSDLFKGAVRNNAACVYLSHNHVDGRVHASLPDYRFTLKAVAASKLLEIVLIDHIVVGPGGHYSIIEHQYEMEDELRAWETKERALMLKGMLPLASSLKGLGLGPGDILKGLLGR